MTRGLFIATILALLAATPLRANLEMPDPALNARQLERAGKIAAARDIDGLLALLRKSHLFVQKEIALELGRMGAAQALPALREYDRRYANFACAESGEFGVAVLLIESKTPAAQKAALLAAATAKPQTGGRYAFSVADAAGRELERFGGDDVVSALANVDTYGARHTVLALQCKKLSDADAIARCIAELEAHETPPKAEAAEEILIAFGAKARSQVEALDARMEKDLSGRPRLHHCKNRPEPMRANPRIRKRRPQPLMLPVPANPTLCTMVALALFAALPPAAHSAEEPASALVITLTADKSGYRAGEDIRLTVTMENTSDAPIKVCVRDCDWSDLPRLDEQYRKQQELAARLPDLADIAKRPNRADELRTAGLPRPLGSLFFEHNVDGKPFRTMLMVDTYGCGTGILNGLMPPGTRTKAEYAIQPPLRPGTYRCTWEAEKPSPTRKEPRPTLHAVSNPVEITIVE